jgi:GNAT superfamily N-acetyltransferase
MSSGIQRHTGRPGVTSKRLGRPSPDLSKIHTCRTTALTTRPHCSRHVTLHTITFAVGFVQATLSTQNGESVAELAWVIASAHQGQGYARHATKAVVRWLRKLGANLIIAHVHPYHQASMAVAAGIGMSASETVLDGEVRWVG